MLLIWVSCGFAFKAFEAAPIVAGSDEEVLGEPVSSAAAAGIAGRLAVCVLSVVCGLGWAESVLPGFLTMAAVFACVGA